MKLLPIAYVSLYITLLVLNWITYSLIEETTTATIEDKDLKTAKELALAYSIVATIIVLLSGFYFYYYYVMKKRGFDINEVIIYINALAAVLVTILGWFLFANLSGKKNKYR